MNLKNRTNQLTDKELEDLICELEAAGFYRRQLIGLTELQERRKMEANNKPVAWTGAEQLRDANTQGCGYIFGLGIPANPGHQIMLYAIPQQVTSGLFISGVRDEDGDCTAVDDADAQFWTVYRRNEDGTCDALMDFMNRESAEKALQMIAPQPAKPEFDDMSINLLPCPFCGSEAHYDSVSVHHLTEKRVYAPACTECSCELMDGPVRNSAGWGWYETKEAAAADWNRREVAQGGAA